MAFAQGDKYPGFPNAEDLGVPTVSFSADEQWVNIEHKKGKWRFIRPVISPWNYTLPSGNRTWWISPTGDDSAAGTKTAPKKTINTVVSGCAAGDIIYLTAGTHQQAMHIQKSGTASKPIIISCEPGSLGKVFLNPPDSFYSSGATNPSPVWLHSVTNVWINGLVIVGPRGRPTAPASIYNRNYDTIGIQWSNGAGSGCKATNNVICYQTHCALKEMGHGGTNIFTEGNIGFEIGGDYRDHGFYCPANNSTSNGNIFFNIWGYGISTSQGDMAGMSRPNGCVVSRNIVFGCGGGIVTYGALNKFYNNVLVNNIRGMFYYGGSGKGGVETVYNNIVVFNRCNNDFPSDANPSDSDYNCFYADYGKKATQWPTWTLANMDSIYNVADYTTIYGGKGAHDQVVDPQFRNWPSGDFRLKSTSPVRQKGRNVGLSGQPAQPDMGAFDATGAEKDITPVKGHSIFYNNSFFDGNDPSPNAADDAAIAVDKTALLPGQTAKFANYTSYSRGINGIMIDISSLPAGGSLSASDFSFKVGNDNIPSAWPLAASPSNIAIRRGIGPDGSDRVTLIWADNAIQKQWLQVTVLANGNTGLSTTDVFYWGNAIGETGNSTTDAMVTPADEVGCRGNPHTLQFNPASITDVYDFNRDGKVGPTEEVIVRNNATNSATALKLIAAP